MKRQMLFLVAAAFFGATAMAWALDSESTAELQRVLEVDTQVFPSTQLHELALDDFNEVDQFLLVWAWKGRLEVNGDAEQFKLSMRWYNHSTTTSTHQRTRDLAKAHDALMIEDPIYRDAISSIENELASIVGYRITEREGRLFVVSLLLERGVLHRIVKRAGPGPETLDPDFVGLNPWGDGRPFTSGVGQATQSFPFGALMFHWCNGLTLSAPHDDPYRKAHEHLMLDDAGYRDAFHRTVFPFSTRVIDALDPHAVADYNKGLWTALTESGVAAQLERQVHVSRTSREGEP